MNWGQIQSKLQLVAKRVRQNKLVDAATAALIEEIPVVGGFLSKYWDSLGGDEESAQNMASFIEAIAEQEKAFNNLGQLVEAQGEHLINQGTTLGEILVRVDETRDNVKAIKTQISRFIETLRIPSAKVAFEIAAAIGEDYRKSTDLIQHAENVLQHAGAEADAHSYYQLGMVYLSMSEFEHAEASLLKAVALQPELVDALIGLAMIYQRQATEHLRKENYGLAEDAAVKAEGYVKSALLHDPTDVSVQVHLGYLYKDLAQRYAGTGKSAQAQLAADKAWRCFETAVKIEPENASAHNGLGSLCLVRRDYDGAIEHCGKAVSLMPDYLFANFDLAQAYYAKALNTQETLQRLQIIQKGLEAYIKIVELDDTPGHDRLPPYARQAIDKMYHQIIAQLGL
jgi:tetratricopeptide (TPR) repeat protein